jgi:hypothetical protein
MSNKPNINAEPSAMAEVAGGAGMILGVGGFAAALAKKKPSALAAMAKHAGLERFDADDASHRSAIGAFVAREKAATVTAWAALTPDEKLAQKSAFEVRFGTLESAERLVAFAEKTAGLSESDKDLLRKDPQALRDTAAVMDKLRQRTFLGAIAGTALGHGIGESAPARIGGMLAGGALGGTLGALSANPNGDMARVYASALERRQQKLT